MQQTLDFLSVIDKKAKKKNPSLNNSQLLIKDNNYIKRVNRYPYAHSIGFNEANFNEYPKWLTQKHGFTEFMYKNYEQKLMSIPKICQKEYRSSDEKYFLSLFLSQVLFFSKVPQVVIDIILNNLKTRYYSAGQIIHQDNKIPQFMAIIYLGSVQYKSNKRSILKQKLDAILTEAFYERTHQQTIAKEQTILLCLDKSIYSTIKIQLRQQIETQDRDQIGQLMRSHFFTQLHIKDTRANNFYNDLSLQFYFNGQTIVQAGSDIRKFYIVFKGEVIQENHIYVREHNKWPLANKKWQVRAVYNSYHKNNIIRKNQFFGDQEVVQNTKFKAKYITNSSVIILSMPSDIFMKHMTNQDMKKLKKFRVENVDLDYNQFQNSIREKNKVKTMRKNIILKAINTSLANKSQLSPKNSPRKMALIKDFQKSMMKKAFFSQNTTL